MRFYVINIHTIIETQPNYINQLPISDTIY